MRKLFFVFVVVLAMLVGTTALAQGTAGTLVGTVTSGGSPLPGVTVTVTSPALQGTRATVTSEAGAYNISGLPPGDYNVRFELAGLQTRTERTKVSIAQTTRVDADLKVAAVAEAITVTASAPAILETTQVGTNVTTKMLDKLPIARTPAAAVSLAPGVTSGIAGAAISGAPSYDNVYLVNGTVVNENLRGQPHNLFIEDAIQETTILSGGSISAEYGRFTGGVVSTVTKSGGNEFSGSIRDNLTNPKWRAKTPWPTEADHIDQISHIWEETLGGFLWKDRLWFFGAGRQRKTDEQRFTSVLNLPYTFGVNEKRLEGKLTGQITDKHNLWASYIDVSDKRINDSQFTIMDLGSLFNRELPNSLLSAQYNGIITNNLLLTASYSNKKFAFVGSGSPYRDLIKGTLMVDEPTGRRYWTSTFCGTCTDEERNNFSYLLKSNYFLSTQRFGSHNVVAGIERYSETRLANNHQSGSDFRIRGNIVPVADSPDKTQIFPRLDQNTLIQWNPIFEFADGSHLRTDSVFINDKWDFNQHLSFNIGVRYDKNNGRDDSGNLVSDDSAFSPRLGLQYDIAGNGRHRVNLSFARYVTKIADGNVGGSANAAGNPSSITWRYRGPAINPPGTPASQLLPTDKALEILWNWFNSVGATKNTTFLNSVGISGLDTIIPEPIVSPAVDEITLGYGIQFGRAVVRADFVKRDWNNFYAALLLPTNPKYTDPFGQQGDVSFTINDDDGIERTYRGLQFQTQWQGSRFFAGGTYTWSKLRGNDSGESGPSATIRNLPLDKYYPEYLNYEQRMPTGWLAGDARHRAKAWVSYELSLGRAGALTPSVLQTYETGYPYSAIGTIDASGRAAGNQFNGIPQNPGYSLSALGTSHTYYFTERGGFRTEAVKATDFALQYQVPIFSRFTFFAKGSVTNVFDNDAVDNPDTTVFTRRTSSTRGLRAFNPKTETPIECPQDASAATCTAMGAHWQKGPNFGKPFGVSSYQTPRTYSFTTGLRF